MADSDPILDRWYDDGRFWHAFKGDRTFWCGLTLLRVDESRLIQGTVESPYPPEPCIQCVIATGMRDAEEESLEHAKARGYQRVEMDDPIV